MTENTQTDFPSPNDTYQPTNWAEEKKNCEKFMEKLFKTSAKILTRHEILDCVWFIINLISSKTFPENL